jgi:hypothetical protein
VLLCWSNRNVAHYLCHTISFDHAALSDSCLSEQVRALKESCCRAATTGGDYLASLQGACASGHADMPMDESALPAAQAVYELPDGQQIVLEARVGLQVGSLKCP